MTTSAEGVASLQYDKTNNMSLPDVLKTISDDKSFAVFQLIANVNSNREIILKNWA